MRQSDIIKAAYEVIYDKLTEIGKEAKLFSVNNEGKMLPKSGIEANVCLGISDVCQLSPDKNGERVEENEMSFESPTRIGCLFSITLVSKFYPNLLETTGLLIQYFKDNNVIMLGDYKWHGENEGKIFIEPVIRKPESKTNLIINEQPAVILEYQMEIGINSLKGTLFKRVEKKRIDGKIID